MPNTDGLNPVKTTEEAQELGRKGGLAKKGSKHLSTHIQNMLNDEDFTLWLADQKGGTKEFKGAPIKAIITTAMIKAANNDAPAREWLARHGYGSTLKIEVDDPREKILNRYLNDGDVDGGQTDGSAEGSSKDTA